MNITRDKQGQLMIEWEMADGAVGSGLGFRAAVEAIRIGPEQAST